MAREHLFELTPREREVAALVVEGLKNREIAERLGIGPETVQAHVSNILSKLGVASRGEVKRGVLEQA